MSQPASAFMVMIVEIVIILYACTLLHKCDKILEEVKELRKLYGNSTVCAHRDESHCPNDKGSVRNETDNKDSETIYRTC